MPLNPEKEQRTGVINAISAYVLWGIAPIYFKMLADVSSEEIMTHRIVWSCVLLLVIIILFKKWPTLVNTFKQPNVLLKLTFSASFLAVNWFLFIWAINNNHLLDASLGYFINPLFSVLLGMIFLGERLRKWQIYAVCLAVTAVAIQVISLGTLPIISLILAGTFGIYGLLRKQLKVDSFIGLFIESALMLPIALLYWHFFINSSTSNMFENNLSLNALLLFAGIITTAPLLCFTAAAKRLALSTVGFFQYIGPSIMFILATYIYQEPLQTEKLVTFILIWIALLLYSADSFFAHKRKKRRVKAM